MSDDELWALIERAGRDDDGAAAREHLAAGFPIHYSEDDTPPGMIVKEWPGGRKQLIAISELSARPLPDAA